MKKHGIRLFVSLLVIVLFASITGNAGNDDKKKAQDELRSIIENVQDSLPQTIMGICIEKIVYKKNNIEMTVNLTDFLTKPQLTGEDINLTPFLDDEAGREIIRRARPGFVMRVISPEGNKTIKISPDDFQKYINNDETILNVSQ